ncbi:hypothetical protein I7I51_04284 [Histoplasma capsulatum]|uniref:Uncharacterized protein n=1 Tax=Ajellomyces capsulatus TaxID=5037 RepID=A0A8A1MD77_AJECA|nr:hypothetical protein I7I51_04284 [Histoplasma capsulatum]
MLCEIDYNDLQAALSSRAQEAEQTCFFDVACLRSQLLLAMIRQISCEFETHKALSIGLLLKTSHALLGLWRVRDGTLCLGGIKAKTKLLLKLVPTYMCWAIAAFVHPRVAHTLWRAHRDFVDLLQSLLVVPQTLLGITALLRRRRFPCPQDSQRRTNLAPTLIHKDNPVAMRRENFMLHPENPALEITLSASKSYSNWFPPRELELEMPMHEENYTKLRRWYADRIQSLMTTAWTAISGW